MKVYNPSSEMTNQMERIYGLNTLINKINLLAKDDKKVILNRIIYSLLMNCTDEVFEAIAEIEIIKLDIYNKINRFNRLREFQKE